jgi:rSAM/selenodomain-associated transferase 2
VWACRHDYLVSVMILSRLRKKEVLIRLACFGVSFIALGLVLRRVDLASLGRVFSDASLIWITAAWVMFGFASAFAAARWHVVLRLSGCAVHPTATLRSVLVGHVFNTVLLGPAGGDIAKSALYSRWYRFPAANVYSTCVLDRLLGGAGFLIFAACTPAFAVYSGQVSSQVKDFFFSWRFGVAAAAVALLLLAVHLVCRSFDRFSPLRKISAAILANGSRLLVNPRLSMLGLFYSVLAHVCMTAVFIFCLKAVTQTSFSLAALFWVFPVISVITSAPVTFAGAGLREGAALFFLGLYGIPGADAVAASLLVLATYLVWAGIGAIVAWRGESAHELASERAVPRTLSVVIPTLNEAEALPETLARVRQVAEVIEIIVVDGGSNDGTPELAAKLGCHVLTSSPCRGGQLRAGAAMARGDVILLLHADTWLPPEAGQAVLNCLRDPVVMAGGFWKVFRENNLHMAGSRLRCAMRLYLFGNVMGDQTIFIRREALDAIGGIPDLPLFEELELGRRVRTIGRMALACATVTTSARRFARQGALRTYWRMAQVTIGYHLGAPAHKLARIYDKEQHAALRD